MMRLLSLASEDRGSASIETAVSLIAILAVFFGIAEFCRAIYADLYVGYAAQAASRYAMVRGSSWNGAVCTTSSSSSCTATSANITNFVKSMAPVGISTGTDLTVTSMWSGNAAVGTTCNATNGNNSPGCMVQIQVTYNFHFVVPLISSNSLTLGSTSAITISQ